MPTPPHLSGRNDIRLLTYLDSQPVSNFRLKEFETSDGLAMVHAATLLGLEKVRRDLRLLAGEDVWVIITDAARTPEELERLGARLGWSDQGGSVSRDSRHLTRYGGIAVDFVAVIARTRRRIPQRTLGDICRRHFDFVKDDYADGHVHADQRSLLQAPGGP